MAKAHIKRLQRAAARVSELNRLADAGDVSARKVKKAMQGSWVKRNPAESSLHGFFDRAKSREMKRSPVVVLK